MKKYIFLIIVVSFFVSCSSGKKIEKKQENNIKQVSNEEQLKLDKDKNSKLGFEAYKSNDYEKAEKYLLLAEKGGDNSYELNRSLGDINLKKNNKSKAMNFYAKAYELNDKDKNFILRYGNILIKEKKYKEAKNIFEAEFAKDESFAEAVISLLNIYKIEIVKENNADKKKKILDKAESKAQKALKELPGNALLYNNLAQIYYIMDKKPLAFYILSIAEKSSKNLDVIYNTIGWYYENEGVESMAKSYYKKSLKENTSYLPALRNIARFYMNTLNYNDAKSTFEKILTLKKDNYNAKYGIALTELGLFKFDDSIKILKELYQIKKEDKIALMLATIYHKQLTKLHKYQEDKDKKKEFLLEAKKWYKAYVDVNSNLKKDNEIIMNYNGIDEEIKWLNSGSEEESKKIDSKKELSKEQKKKVDELKKTMEEEAKEENNNK